MIYIRPYKKCDAATILGWIKDEVNFYQWSADRYDHYPATEEDMNKMYDEQACSDCFFPMSACDDGGLIGHFIMRYTDVEKKTLRLGFIIIDDRMRGQGYGKEMVLSATKYAFDHLGAKKVTLGVFDNNPEAEHCYRKAGFHERLDNAKETLVIMGEEWNCVELERKNHYFLSESEKQEQGGSDYFEFRFRNSVADGEESLYLSASDYEVTGMKQLLKREVTNFDQYGHNEISLRTWLHLLQVSRKKGEAVHYLLEELQPWAERALKKNGGFDIIGL